MVAVAIQAIVLAIAAMRYVSASILLWFELLASSLMVTISSEEDGAIRRSVYVGIGLHLQLLFPSNTEKLETDLSNEEGMI